MSFPLVKVPFLVCALLGAGTVLAAQEQTGLPPGHPTFTKPRVEAPKGKGGSPKTLNRSKRVDINSATREELKRVPGIDDSLTDRIIAGRPYLTKSRLVSRKIMTLEAYQAIQKQIVAQQKPTKK